LCAFSSSICSKVIGPLKLDELQAEIVIILCQLEMFFPPSFFDIMVHLLVHLVREIKFCGPIYLRGMYPIERSMKILKGYVKNQYHTEASMIERYNVEESVEFCSDYMEKAKPIGVPQRSWLNRCSISNNIRGVSVVSKDREEFMQAYLYILNNTNEVMPYLSAHKVIVKENNPRQSENKSGVKMDESGMTLVDFRKVGYRDEPFIMAQQASQIFYVKDHASEHWFVAFH